MDPEDAPSLFDELIDRSLRGEAIDIEKILAEHPDVSEEEQRQLRTLCGHPVVAAGEEAVPEQVRPLAPDAALPFTRIGEHRILRRIGAGATGVVFLAEDESLGRQVAIKVLGPDMLGTGERADRFLREVRAAARLRHPGIASVHQAGERDGYRYMVMEYVPGSSLHDVMVEAAANGSRPARADILRWGIEIASALRAAHEAGITHRDVKPSNIRITPEGRAVLLDFGLAREAGDATLTETGAFRGSPQYASPEQVDPAGRTIDSRTDIYSLGATLYELLTGVAPYRSETREQLFHHILTRDPAPPRQFDPSIPKDLETVVLVSLDKDPGRRPQTAAALAADLEAVRDGRPVAVRPPSAMGRAVRWSRRQPAKAALVAAALVGIPLIAGLAGYIVANFPKIDEAREAERARQLAGLLQEGFLECGEGEPAHARGLFEQARTLAPESVEARAGYALALFCDEDYAATLDYLARLDRDARAAWVGRLQSETLSRMRRKEAAAAAGPAAEPPSSAVDFLILGMMQIERYHAGYAKAAQEAFEDLRRANLMTHAAMYQFELGHAAWHAGRHKEARELAAAVEQLWPESPERDFAEARTLMGADPDAAAGLLEKAGRSSPRSLLVREFITGHLAEGGSGGQIDLAIELGRETVRRAPSRCTAHVVLAMAFQAKNDHPSAIAELEEAMRLRPLHTLARRELVESLTATGALERAIALGRETAELAPNDFRNWNMLGIAYRARGDVEDGIRAFGEALRAEPDVPEIQFNLGNLLLKHGEFAKGLDQLRRAHERGSKNPHWKYPTQRAIAGAERLIRLDERLDAIRRGTAETTPDECCEVAREVCGAKRLFAEAADLYAKAFADDPSLMCQLAPHHLLDGASMAVAAASGSGDDAPKDPAERTRLRELARGWLEEALRSCAAPAASGAASRPAIEDALRSWTTASRLASVRSDEGLAALPATEAATWRELWKRCDALLGTPPGAASRVTR